MSATDNDLQVSTTERKVAFATAADAEYKLADGRVGVRSLMHLRDRSRQHISAWAGYTTACNHFLSRRTAGGKGRAAGCQSHRCLERQVVHCAACGSWNLTHARCQRHATATKAYNWASAISWTSGWTAVSSVTSGKPAGWSVHVHNTHPNFERSNYG